MKNTIKTNPYRIAIQVAVIAVILFLIARSFVSKTYIADFEAYCPFGGIMAFSSFLLTKSLACSMTSAQIAMGGVLIIAILFFSKLFCSFICPVGSVSEWIGKAGEKLKLRYTITGYADLLLRGVKYAILFVTVYYTLTSSELFCRKFDPYYATLSGFGGDVSMVWGIVALVIVIAGSFFIRLFWCKYLCPVGALSNIFRFMVTFIIVIAGYLLMRLAGIAISFVWPLALICLISYMLEFYSLRSTFFPVFRIRRHQDLCTSCKLCDRNCPMAIEIHSVSEVKHIDCHMCGDCIHVCPEKGALTIDRKGKKWLPALITILLVTFGILAGKTFELPTLSLYWGDESKKEMMKEYTKNGLKNVKCYGSSAAFANQIKNVPGVAGVTTFVKTNTVKILFDSSLTDTMAIQKSIFSPVRVNLRNLRPEIEKIMEFDLGVDNFFDPLDSEYLRELLLENSSVIGFTTEFDCPVKVVIFADAAAKLTESEIAGMVEQKTLLRNFADGSSSSLNLSFRVRSCKPADTLLTRDEYISRISVKK
jgi:polyferredoxin/copper chaperone CopZ